MSLDELRHQIDQIDRDLVSLLERRLQVVSQVAAYKQATGKAVLDSKREEAVLKQVADRVTEKDLEAPIVAIFSALMSASREYQANLIEKGQ